MAECSYKKSISSNEKGANCSERKEKNSGQNDTEGKKENSNVKKVNKLFAKMGLEESNEKMDLSQLKEIHKIPRIESKDDHFSNAGKIISFLENISVILVQPPQEENSLLNIGTNLFVSTAENWILLGQIDEIFGNIKDPMYAVTLSPPENKLFNVDDKVYFMSNHPTTSLFHIETNTKNKFNVIYHN